MTLLPHTPDALARFEALLLPLLDDAYTFACHLMHDEHDAQDVVQESYLRALRYFDGFAGDDARGWLLTIVRNTAHTWRRRNHPSTDVSLDDAVRPPAAPRASEADARVLAESTRAELASALARLAPEWREVLVLREVEDLSYKEIARVVGVPIGTVMSRLSRARARMQHLLGARREAC